MANAQVIEGTWEEVVQQAANLAGSGRRVKLIVPSDALKAAPPPDNAAALALLDEWIALDRAVSPEEREEANREGEEFLANLEANPVSFHVPKGD